MKLFILNQRDRGSEWTNELDTHIRPVRQLSLWVRPVQRDPVTSDDNILIGNVAGLRSLRVSLRQLQFTSVRLYLGPCEIPRQGPVPGEGAAGSKCVPYLIGSYVVLEPVPYSLTFVTVS